MPLMCSVRRASITASVQNSIFLKRFLPSALLRFETIFPRLFRMRPSAVIPPDVFFLDPRNTIAFAMRPFAMLLFLPSFFASFFIADGRAMQRQTENGRLPTADNELT